MWDPATGGGYDGLHADGPNLNQGAESTLALISDPPARAPAGAGAGDDRRDGLGDSPARSARARPLPGDRPALRARPRPRRQATTGARPASSSTSSPSTTTRSTRTARRRHRALRRSPPRPRGDLPAPRRSHRATASIPASSCPRSDGCCSAPTFTHEYAVEAARCATRRAVAHPDQTGVPAGALRFVMSVRQIGEGHRSSIGFRTGLVDRRRRGHRSTPPGRSPPPATIGRARSTADAFRSLARRLRRRHARPPAGCSTASASASRSTSSTSRLAELEAQRDTRRNVARRPSAASARIAAPHATPPTSRRHRSSRERVLCPATAVESNGIEDARFVRFVDDDGTRHLLRDLHRLRRRRHRPAAAGDHRLPDLHVVTAARRGRRQQGPGPVPAPDRRAVRRAVAPRRGQQRGRLLRRHPPSGRRRRPLECPAAAWEAVQVGNCGSPIETDDGWLVLTHGVGPMRTYSIGAGCSTSTTRPRSSAACASPLLTPDPTSRTATCPTSSTPAAPSLHDEHAGDPLRHRRREHRLRNRSPPRAPRGHSVVELSQPAGALPAEDVRRGHVARVRLYSI